MDISDGPEYFDPFMEMVPDFSNYSWDPEVGIINSEGQPYQCENVSNICQNIAESGDDPNQSLKSLLEAEFQKNREEPTDPVDIVPDSIFQIVEDGIYFKDSAFVSATLTSLQQCRRKDVQGYIIMPARFSSRIANHNVPTPVFFITEENIPETIRAKFD